MADSVYRVTELVARAEKLAALLPDLRHNQSAESSTHRR